MKNVNIFVSCIWQDTIVVTTHIYNTFPFNKHNEYHAGTAIAIKTSHFQINRHFHSDMIALTIDITLEPITIGTAYIPPRR